MKPYYEDSAVTIYHGDCRELLPFAGPADFILTDPPYGIGVNYGDSYQDERDTYWEWFLPCVKLLREHVPLVVFTHRIAALKHIVDWDHVAIWHKPFYFGSRLGNSCVMPKWEPIFIYGLHTIGTKSKFTGDVFEINPTNSGQSRDIGRRAWQEWKFNGSHPCPKPGELCSALIQSFGQFSQTILDPFMGSGTTLRAAKDLGRKAIGIEIEERYCEIAARRMEQEVMDFGASAICPAPVAEQTQHLFTEEPPSSVLLHKADAVDLDTIET